jgi:glycogen debranching enzyme
VNQGWKDSWDAIRHRDGRLARPPIALSEVQGYVFAAYIARAEIARDVGDVETFERYQRKAHDLYRRFNEDFWLDEYSCYAMALDADKRPVAALGSNIGHCLWTGIVDPSRSDAVAEALVSPEMFSGWGVRTLATSMPAYNPVSYHNGSVWPHDNAICAAGLARYGFRHAAHRIIDAQLAVADHFGGRLPELFSGFPRGRPSTPAAYPTSCSPQAWAAASPLLWLRVMLGLDPTPQGQVCLHPDLPESVHRMRVTGVDLGNYELAVEVDVTGTRFDGPGLRVLHSSRPPLSDVLDR